MAAPTGNWNFFTSGSANPGSLSLSQSFARGSPGGITGTLNGTPLTAVWDEASQILSMAVATAGGTGANDAGFTIQAYTGTLFQPFATANGLVAEEGVPLMLVGNFGTGKAGATVGPFNQSGWFATNTTKFKEKEGKEGKDGKDSAKDHKDGKEGHPDTPPEVQSRGPVSDDVMTQAMQMEGSNLSEVRIATGKSFIVEEERPVVGSAALQN